MSPLKTLFITFKQFKKIAPNAELFLKWFYVSFFLLLFTPVLAQQKKDSLKAKDSLITVRQPVKIRFGFDVGKYIWAKLQDSQSYDFYIDANFYKDYYILIATGHENHLTDNNLLNYNTIGNYYKIGISQNFYHNWLTMDNDITIGLNYAFAKFDYLLNTYRINQPGAVYPPEPITIHKSIANNKAQWFELAAQIQVETFKHLYVGYNVAFKYLINSSDIQDFEIAYIPGFYNKNTYSNFGFGMQYFISYQLKF